MLSDGGTTSWRGRGKGLARTRRKSCGGRWEICVGCGSSDHSDPRPVYDVGYLGLW